MFTLLIGVVIAYLSYSNTQLTVVTDCQAHKLVVIRNYVVDYWPVYNIKGPLIGGEVGRHSSRHLLLFDTQTGELNCHFNSSHSSQSLACEFRCGTFGYVVIRYRLCGILLMC